MERLACGLTDPFDHVDEAIFGKTFVSVFARKQIGCDVGAALSLFKIILELAAGEGIERQNTILPRFRRTTVNPHLRSGQIDIISH